MQQPPTTTQPKDKRAKNFQEVSLGFPKRVALQEAARCPQCTTPSCNPGCPLGVDVPEFIRILRTGDVKGALKKIREQNVLPGICGRICSAPCEDACILDIENAAIGIRALERYAADYGRERLSHRKKTAPTGRKIAIIGSGPSGLTAAAFLAQKEYQVTIFEALPFVGGVLRYGIPEFRLPESALQAEIEEIKSWGVVIKTNSAIGAQISLDQLFTEGFSAVLLAIGSGRPQWTKDLPETTASGIYYVEEILLQSNTMAPRFLKQQIPLRLGNKVIVLGSDSAALDCARVCVRLGKAVTLVFESMEEGLEIQKHDLQYAREEGVRLESLARPLEIATNEQKAVCGLKCVRMDFADPDGKGQWRLIPVPDSQFTLPADTLIVSPQRKPNGSFLNKIPGLRLNEDGTIWINPENAMTSVDRIFAAGNAVSGYGQAVKAMASAKKAAEKIHEYLK